MLTHLALIALASAVPAPQVTAPQVLSDTSTAPQGRFGAAVAVAGTHMVVGAPGVPQAGSGRGAAHFYRRVSGVWQSAGMVSATGASSDPGFGEAVDITTGTQGTFAIIGAPREAGSGAVHLYQLQGSTWQHLQMLAPTMPLASEFGASVAIDGERALIGQASEGGRVFLASRTGPSSWGLGLELARPAGVFNSSEFGASLDLLADLAVVGAPGEDAASYDSGAAYVYRYVGQPVPGFFEEARLEHPSAATLTYQGASVALTRTAGSPGLERVLVGSQDGQAFVWSQPAGGLPSWSVEAVLTAFDGEDGGFGLGVAIDQNRALVGAPYRRGSGQGSGLAFDFELMGAPATWQPKSLMHPGAAPAREFGAAVALAGEAAVVGTVGPFPLGLNSGRVLGYSLGERLGEAHCASRPNSTGSIASLCTFGSETASDQMIGFDVVGLPPLALGFPIASYTRDQVPALGGGTGDLCLGGQIFRLSRLLQASSASGSASTLLNFSDLPPGLIVAPGTTLSFQWWHRDAGPSGPTSGSSHATELVFD